jgi:hypothetical protein
MYERAISGQRLRIPAADYNAAMAAAEAHARSANTGAGLPRGGMRMEFGKLDQNVVGDVNTGATFSVWHGPAWGVVGDAPTGDVLPVDYSTHTLDLGTYIIATYHRGKWYVQPWECP